MNNEEALYQALQELSDSLTAEKIAKYKLAAEVNNLQKQVGELTAKLQESSATSQELQSVDAEFTEEDI